MSDADDFKKMRDAVLALGIEEPDGDAHPSPTRLVRWWPRPRAVQLPGDLRGPGAAVVDRHEPP
jgi:hypothetical protein